MQKKLIALAVAGLVSGGAFAQSNVTIYGTLDVNVNSQNTGFGSKLSLGSGGLAASRLGFKGEEGLGNGMKAVWVLESGINMDTQTVGAPAPALGINAATASSGGSPGTGAQLFARQGYAGLEGGFGGLTFGRQYTGSYIALAVIMDPVGGGLYGGPLVTGGPTGLPSRWNNSVVYKTPTMAGFRGHLSYTTGLENNTNAELTTAGAACPGAGGGAGTCTNDKAGRGYDLALLYGNGPIAGVLSTWSYNGGTYTTSAALATSETGLAKRTGWALGGSYDFQVAKLHAGYISARIKDNNYENVTVANSKTAMWTLGLVVPVGGAGKVVLNATGLNDKSSNDRDMNAWGLSYLHDLSKRTTLYANYGKLNNNSNSVYSLVSGGDVTGTTMGAAGSPAAPSATAGYDPSGFMVGMKHSF